MLRSKNSFFPTWFWLCSLFFLCYLILPCYTNEILNSLQEDAHNNWAVLVCTSRFWFNYRHIANTLSMYRTVKRLGIRDENIILMLADDVACNPRNRWPARVINDAHQRLDLYGNQVEVDYRGYDVTVENFIRLLTGRHESDVPRSKRLRSDHQSRIFVYMTGHGGDEFLKFQDQEELAAQDLADAFEQMYEKKRYKEIFFMIDTCQANTMYSSIRSPGILSVGSSKKDQSSYSHHMDWDLGVSVIDRFTHANLRVLEQIDRTSQRSLAELFASYNPNEIHSDPGISTQFFTPSLTSTKITDFLAGVSPIRFSTRPLLTLSPMNSTVPSSSSNVDTRMMMMLDTSTPLAKLDKLNEVSVTVPSMFRVYLHLGCVAVVFTLWYQLRIFNRNEETKG